jgi:hypothetical protein
VVIEGVRPPGGIELRAPFGALAREVVVNGTPGTLLDGGRAVRLAGPATVEFGY